MNVATHLISKKKKKNAVCVCFSVKKSVLLVHTTFTQSIDLQIDEHVLLQDSAQQIVKALETWITGLDIMVDYDGVC